MPCGTVRPVTSLVRFLDRVELDLIISMMELDFSSDYNVGTLRDLFKEEFHVTDYSLILFPLESLIIARFTSREKWHVANHVLGTHVQ